MVRDVATRWNSTAELVGRALELRKAINLLVISEQHNKSRSARLKRFQLTNREWDLLEKLFPLLEVLVYYSLWSRHLFMNLLTPTVFPHRDGADFAK
jgi:hypothetical protein